MKMIENTSASMEKYKQIILYCIKQCADADGRIDAAKLAALVYLADFTWYYDHLVSMSGMVYRKLGCVPVADEFFKALDEMVKDNLIVCVPKEINC